MFAFFLNDQFMGFWANSVGDKFVEITCAQKLWAQELVKVYYYANLSGEDLDEFELDGFNVRVLKESVLIKTCEGDLFYSNGIMLHPC
jgi:hypothetical protein